MIQFNRKPIKKKQYSQLTQGIYLQL